MRELPSRTIYAFLLGIALLSSCTREPATSRVGGDVDVLIPWPDDEGQVHLQRHTLHGVINLTEMNGDFAKFYFSPKLGGSEFEGDPARGRFIKNKAGVYVPADETSQQMAMVYARMEELAALDAQAGAGNVLSWPAKVGVAMRLTGPDGQKVRNNSFYDGTADALLLVPNPDGELPLAANPGVIGHEHFHALFEHLVLRPLLAEGRLAKTLAGTAHEDKGVQAALGEGPTPVDESASETESDHRLELTVFMKTVNEGLADVWGWIYSGDPDFVGRSLPAVRAARTLRADNGFGLMPGDLFRDQVRVRSRFSPRPEMSLNEFAYGPANGLARTLRRIFLGGADDRGEEGKAARLRLARRLVKALPSLPDLVRLSANADGTYPLPELRSVLDVILKAEPLNDDERVAADAFARENLAGGVGRAQRRPPTYWPPLTGESR